MKCSVIPSARLLVDHLMANGIKDIVISPGSRSAPLVLSFTTNPFFRCYSIVDERCAAFFALGMSQNQGKPVALVCTSGSAVLNYYPGISEAYYSTIPLIAISADRPPYKIDIGDGQTIRQTGVFSHHVGYAANLKIDVSHAQNTIQAFAPELLLASQETVQHYNAKEIEQALTTALEKSLPVHINIPFEEPLYGVVDLEENNKVSPVIVNNQQGTQNLLEQFMPVWKKAKRKMILVGVNKPDKAQQHFLEILANDPSVLVFTETTSNLHHPHFFPSIDSIIFPIEKSKHKEDRFQELQPDLLLTFGGLIVSKKVKAFLRKYKPKHHWHVDKTRATDTFFSLSHHFKLDIDYFLAQLTQDYQNTTSSYFEHWHAVKNKYEVQRNAFLETIPFSDFLVFEKVQGSIPKNYQLHLSNSSTVRYAQLFDCEASLSVFCNRGTSGIDGSVSTAIGASIYHHTPTLLITGDLSFFYDSNGLWNKYIRNDFRIVLLNNAGGGIFRILPGKEDSDGFQTFFETTHQMTAAKLCEQYGFEYSQVHNSATLEVALNSFYKKGSQPKLLEV
ncbi:MAG: 2-succinyl-5-enolpyruvyl-6-hydroxy-3-cyclohexene-1-carboxylic-acid synthase [Bacteroidota bacterium]